MSGARGQGMGDFVQNGVAHFLFAVELRHRLRKRNQVTLQMAASKPPPRAVERKPPALQPMEAHQIRRQLPSIVWIQNNSPGE
jgi:hypothetical protein